MPKCPWHAGPIKTPCTLDACDFFITGHPLRCGFVGYQKLARTLKSSEETPWETLADWLAAEPDSLEQQAKQAYALLKRSGIDTFFLGSMSPVEQTRYCVVCEKPALLTEGSFGYCSAECKSYMPPEALSAELLWEHPIAELLNYLRALDFKTISRYLKVSKDTYTTLLWQHLGVCPEPDARKRKFSRSPRTPTREQLLRRIQLSKLWARSS